MTKKPLVYKGKGFDVAPNCDQVNNVCVILSLDVCRAGVTCVV